MGIPLYREPTAVSPAAHTKLPVACPYAAGTLSQPTRSHHHHHHNAPGLHSQSGVPSTLGVSIDTQDPDAQAAASSSYAISRAWRQMPRVHATRDRVADRPVESHERSTVPSSRYTQRIVRSAPGTREFDDEHRAAELVDLYFQELARIRAATTANAQSAEHMSTDATAVPARSNTERVMEMVARRQRRNDSADHQAVAQDRRTMHETLLRQQQRAQRAPRVVLHSGTVAEHEALSVEQEMQDLEYDL